VKPASDATRLPGCPDCGGHGFIGYDVQPGHRLFGKVQPCPNEQYHGAERVKRLAGLSGLYPGDLKRRLADIAPMPGNEQALKAAWAFLDNPYGWLYLWGGPGNAKSEILIAIVNELNQSGRGPAVYLKFSVLLNKMREAFTEASHRQERLTKGDKLDELDNLGYLDRFELIKSIRVLAIDEIDKVRMTAFAQEFQFDFFDERYRQGIHGETMTLFASQSSPNDMPGPLKSRFNDGHFVAVENKAGDARPDMERE
jgi:chromosomal replication initiation ATPase DnaA